MNYKELDITKLTNLDLSMPFSEITTQSNNEVKEALEKERLFYLKRSSRNLEQKADEIKERFLASLDAMFADLDAQTTNDLAFGQQDDLEDNASDEMLSNNRRFSDHDFTRKALVDGLRETFAKAKEEYSFLKEELSYKIT